MTREDAAVVIGTGLLAALAGAWAVVMLVVPPQPGPLPLPPGAGVPAVVVALVAGGVAAGTAALDRLGRRGRQRRAVEQAATTGTLPPDATPDVWIPLLLRHRDRLGTAAVLRPIAGLLWVVLAVGHLLAPRDFYSTGAWSVMLVLAVCTAVDAVLAARRRQPRIGRLIAQLQEQRLAVSVGQPR